MAGQDAKQDRNRFPALVAHTGTAGTAETVKVVADSAGAVTVSGASAGTVVEIEKGTIGTVGEVGQIHNAGTVAGLPDPVGSVIVTAGTVVTTVGDSEGGTLDTIGTLGSVANIGKVHNAGTVAALPDPVGSVVVTVGTVTTTIGDLTGGTVDLITDLNSGSVVVTSGTLGSVGNIAKVHNAGTVAALPDPVGSVVVTVGTVTTTIGDLEGGTIDLITDLNSGSVVVTSGTIGSVGNIAKVHNAGSVAELPDLPGGTVDAVTNVANVAKGTLLTLGTLGSVAAVGKVHDAGTIAELPDPLGSVVVTVGTVTTTIGDLEGGTIDLITDLNSGSVVVTSGTLGSVGNVAKIHNAGTIAELPDPLGSVVVTVGTVTTTMGDLSGGTIDLITSIANLAKGTVTALAKGTISAGTIGTVVGLGTATNLGSVTNVGTIKGIDSIVLPDPLGSVVVTVGTVTTTMGDLSGGTIDLITDLNSGSVEVTTISDDLPGGTIDAVTNVANVAKGTLLTLGTLGSVAAVGQVHNAGTIAELPDPLGSVVVTVGTVTTTMGDLSGGTIDLLTSGSLSNIAMLHAGTIDDAAISALPDPLGSVVVTVGTVTTTMGDTEGGTLDLLTGVGTLGSISNIAVVHNAGTVAALPDLPGGTVDLVSGLPDPVGSVVVTVGTVTTIADDLPGGTVDLVTGLGTLGSISDVAVVHNAGTIAEGPFYSYKYQAAASADVVVKAGAGNLHAIVVGKAVASSVIEVSDDASDGDGDVVIYLEGDTLGPALYPVNMAFGTGITSDITNQSNVTFIYS